ncbi:diaminopimelate epimerase [Fructobacillus sp. M2-14]|uniref:Diaminopimelate epimerase n=1 Tax=Fructobacillus broussonetiae TaxID=2713173 RepID=A0ABS5QY97_9LACO|nr:diaminopimelate epimerase [Fructobacillus broussonetiae]MBS9338178.1 diaminopimelate epimerase [Fructobacillus broussonetiae]
MINLIHVHGSKNQFYLLDQTLLEKRLPCETLTRLTVQICQQSATWSGADGLLVVDAPTHDGPLGKMTVINSDGSIASMCGNGLRTVARYLSEKFDQSSFTVETEKSDLRVQKEKDFAPGVPAFSVEISPVSFHQEAFPFTGFQTNEIIKRKLPELDSHLTFSAIAVPNPHLISFVTTAGELDETLGSLGKRLNSENPYFPDGVNVNFGKVLGQNKLFVRTFERGVGFTNACGTGMSATSYAYAMNHSDSFDASQPIIVYNLGGMVKTRIHDEGNRPWIELIGNATFLDTVLVSEEALQSGQLDLSTLQTAPTREAASYDQFVAALPKLNPLVEK